MRHITPNGVIRTSRSVFRSNTYNAIRLIAGIFTLLILLGYQYLPARSVGLLRDAKYTHTVYPGDNATQWSRITDRKFSCTFQQ
ncbi:MAG TPA: hypothetical protein VIV27_07095, partial [Halioglobus sp.]